MIDEIDCNNFFELNWPCNLRNDLNKTIWNGREISSAQGSRLTRMGFDLAEIVQNSQEAKEKMQNRSAVILCENITVTELFDREREKRTAGYIGTVGNPDGTNGSDPRLDAISEFIQETGNLHEKLEELKQYAIEVRNDSLRQKIEELQIQKDRFNSEALAKLLSAIGEAVSVAFSLPIFPVAIHNFIQACRDFRECADKYCESLDVRGEIERLMKMEQSLDKNREHEKLNELRHQ